MRILFTIIQLLASQVNCRQFKSLLTGRLNSLAQQLLQFRDVKQLY